MTASPGRPLIDTLWLGVHKTGTTFLQKSLDLSQAELQAAGIAYLELSEFRRLYTRPLLHADHPDAPAAPPPRLEGQRQRLIFDENILALVQNALGPTSLYPTGANRARKVADYLGLVRPQIVLGLRCFSGFLPSLYCEALKSTPFRSFRDFNGIAEQSLSWDDLVGRLATAFPQSDILIYTAEILRHRERPLLAQVTGLPQGAITLQAQGERPGFSQAAVQAMHALHQTRPVQRADVQAINRTFPRGPGVAGFDPWTTQEAARLDARYAEDLARLIQRPQVRFLDPALQAT